MSALPLRGHWDLVSAAGVKLLNHTGGGTARCEPSLESACRPASVVQREQGAHHTGLWEELGFDAIGGRGYRTVKPRKKLRLKMPLG